jgi:hypothetical protein
MILVQVGQTAGVCGTQLTNIDRLSMSLDRLIVIQVKILNKLWGWMNGNKLKTIFLSGVIIDFWANWYSYAIVHD